MILFQPSEEKSEPESRTKENAVEEKPEVVTNENTEREEPEFREPEKIVNNVIVPSQNPPEGKTEIPMIIDFMKN